MSQHIVIGTKFSGAAARMEIMKNSLLSTGYSPAGIDAGVRIVRDGLMTGDANSTQFTTGEGETYSHAIIGYTASSSAQVLNGYSKEIALVSELKPEELEIYDNKVDELNGKVNFPTKVSKTLTINTNTNTENQSLTNLGFELKQSASFISGRLESRLVPQSLFGQGSVGIKPSAALLEMLLQVTNTVYLKGTVNARSVLGLNFAALTSEGNTVSDHSFVRAIDIFEIGTRSTDAGSRSIVDVYNLETRNVDIYRQALDILLTKISSLSQALHPDLIIVHRDLAQEYGITQGLEQSDSVIRQKYPTLASFVNFSADASHNNHIHISFSAQRAGSFLTPEIIEKYYPGRASGSGGAGAIPPSSITNMTLPSGQVINKLQVSYKNKVNETFTLEEIAWTLYGSGIFTKEVSAIFCAIAKRESGFRPGALNASVASRDFSFGLFQCNLLPKAHGRKTFILKYPREDRELGLRLAYTPQDASTIEELADAVENRRANRSTTDDRIFIPYNQALMLRCSCN